MVQEHRMVRVLGMGILTLGFVAVTRAAGQFPSWLPLQLTGYNRDVIADLNATVRFVQLFDQSCCAWGPRRVALRQERLGKEEGM
jgi:hypothetical protein